MNILYITRKFLPSTGGMQTQSFEFYEALKEKENVYIIPWGHTQLFLPFFLIFALIKSVYYIKRYKIDFVQLGDLALSPLGALLKWLFNKKTLAMAHGKDVSFNNRFYRQHVLRRARDLDGIICVSEFLKGKLKSFGFDEDKLYVNSNGINISKYDNCEKENATKKTAKTLRVDISQKKILLSVSRMVKKKGIARFVSEVLPLIVNRVPEAIYLIVGDAKGEEAKEEKRDIIKTINKKNLEKNVFFLGDVSNRSQTLASIYSASHVYVMPNRHQEGDYEGFGIVALEASLNRLPVIAFCVDGIPQAIENDENGILVNPGDNETFASFAIDILLDEEKRKRLGEKFSKSTREKYNWDTITEKYLDILKGLNKGE